MLRVPLVRVEGKRYRVRPDLTMTPARFAVAATLEREARDQVARDAEREFGFDPSLHFFAGIAHPSFGNVVLGYHPEFSTSAPGSATWAVEVRLYQDREPFEDLAFAVVRQDFLQDALASAERALNDAIRALEIGGSRQARPAAWTLPGSIAKTGAPAYPRWAMRALRSSVSTA